MEIIERENNIAHEKEMCPVCKHGKAAEINWHDDTYYRSVECDYCGLFKTRRIDNYNILTNENFDLGKLPLFLFHNKRPKRNTKGELLFYFIPFDVKDFEDEQKLWPDQQLTLVKPETVEAWYPKTFSEKIDRILLALAKLSQFDGDNIYMPELEWHNLIFIQYLNKEGEYLNEALQSVGRQELFIFSFMTIGERLIQIDDTKSNSHSKGKTISILHEGLARIDELQKHQINSRQAFIAMSFAKDEEPVQKAIENALLATGYEPQIMNKHEHNKQIVPEMLHEIRQSKFVIAEFTSCNNGAYYEAGYAAGLGKEVIHVSTKTSFMKKAHFDIKQKNTVIWENGNYKDLETKLINRIKATIN